MNSSSEPRLTTKRFIALDALRGVAVLMVVYDHLFAVSGERYSGKPFAPVEFIRIHFSAPAGVIQDFGWLGVCIFFLISGFVVTRSAISESTRAFVVRRAFRIVPPLAATIALVMCIDWFGTGLRPLNDYLLGLTLIGYVTVPQVIVVGVAWTLAIEVVFYAGMAVVAPLLKSRHPASAVVVLGLAVLLVIWSSRMVGDSYFLFAATVAYLPILLLGVIAYLWHSSRSGATVSLLLAGGTVVLFIYGLQNIHTSFYKAENSYLVSMFYAVAIFWFSFRVTTVPRWLKFMGDISYSMYLMHGIVGIYAIGWLLRFLSEPWWPLAPIAGLVVSLLASYAMYRLIERRSISLAVAITAPWAIRTPESGALGLRT